MPRGGRSFRRTRCCTRSSGRGRRRQGAPMRARAARLSAQFQQALPEGTAAVGAGLAVAAITSYLYIIVALNALDGSAKASFSAFWAVIFVAGPGFFLPLEQEVGRALAHRRAQGLGGGPLVTKAAKLGALITVLLVVATFATAPLLSDELYHGDMLFVVAVAVGIVGFYVVHLTRGMLAGEGRFRPYGELLAGEGLLRLVGGVGLSVHRRRPGRRVRDGPRPGAVPGRPRVRRCGGRGSSEAGSRRPLLRAVGEPRLAPAGVRADAGARLLAAAIGQHLVATPRRGRRPGGRLRVGVLRRPGSRCWRSRRCRARCCPKLAGLTRTRAHDEFARGLPQAPRAGGGGGRRWARSPRSRSARPSGGSCSTTSRSSASILGLLAVGSGCFIIALT